MPSQLATKIRAKYPGAYDDMDDAALEKSVLAKHPEYQDLATPQPQAGTTPVSASEPGTYWGGFKKSLIDQATHAATGSTDANGLPVVHAASPEVEKFATTPIARPTGIDKVDAFLSPASLAMMAVGGAKALKAPAIEAATSPAVHGTVGRNLRMVSDFDLRKPFKSTLGLASDALEASAARGVPQAVQDAKMGVTRGADMYEMPRAQTVVDRPPRASQTIGEGGTGAPESAPAATGLSPADRASLVKQGMTPEGIAKLEQQMGAATPPTAAVPSQITGTLRVAPKDPAAPLSHPPLQVDQASLPADWKTSVPDKVGHALDPARVDIGAEQAGRAAGMTKQQVRDVATPILDSAPGEASPILPEAALKRMVDSLKALPPGGPEREAYVARATSGKTQWQVENIRRTLEHLGLIVPVAATAGGTLRDAIMKRLRGGSEQPGQQLEQ